MAGLYIHIPFCRSKCFYCDFFSRPQHDEADAYVDALLTEWQLRHEEPGERIETIYIGGGTPSLLSDKQLQKLIAGIGKGIDIRSLKEFTVEANPEDICKERIDTWTAMGINRISIGIQSFNSNELTAIGRRHSAESSVKALECLQKSGINYSADLIYGLPEQSTEEWMANLRTLLQFNPPHFSAYLLSYEPGTRLYAMRENGKVAETDETTACDMYEMLCQTAADNGYRHYEISNFALAGMEAKHNSAYWNLTPYLGLGTSAHSFDGNLRRYNPWDIRRYITSLTERRQTVFETEEESDSNRFNDYVITALRTLNGFSEAFAANKFGNRLTARFTDNVKKLSERTLDNGCNLHLLRNADGNLVIPERLWLRSDAILREIIV